MSGNFAIKGGGGRTPNGKCHLKFPFWFSAHLPYKYCRNFAFSICNVFAASSFNSVFSYPIHSIYQRTTKSVPGILIDVLDLCEKNSRSWLDGSRCSFLSRRWERNALTSSCQVKLQLILMQLVNNRYNLWWLSERGIRYWNQSEKGNVSRI